MTEILYGHVPESVVGNPVMSAQEAKAYVEQLPEISASRKDAIKNIAERGKLVNTRLAVAIQAFFGQEAEVAREIDPKLHGPLVKDEELCNQLQLEKDGTGKYTFKNPTFSFSWNGSVLIAQSDLKGRISGCVLHENLEGTTSLERKLLKEPLISVYTALVPEQEMGDK